MNMMNGSKTNGRECVANGPKMCDLLWPGSQDWDPGTIYDKSIFKKKKKKKGLPKHKIQNYNYTSLTKPFKKYQVMQQMK